MRRILQLKLKFLARLILKKYQPVIIGITGSIGKTSAKEAIALVLGGKFSVRQSQKNYNNEIGLPLTIIGLDSAGRSIFGWFKIFGRAFKLIIIRDKQYPHFLILEMGVDRPGDMDYLLRIVSPTVGVVTAVSYSHLEFFGSLARVQAEKQKIIEAVDNKGLAVLNYDNEATRAMAEVSRAKVLTYGFKSGADLVAQELRGNNFKLNYQGSIVPVFMKNTLGRPAIYAVLAGAALGLHYGLNLLEIAQILSNFTTPKGRLSLLKGMNESLIIDDTYNSSPASALAALETLAEFPAQERYAVLGDMLELGDYTETGHKEVGQQAAALNLHYLITVGDKSLASAEAARAAGFKASDIYSFPEAVAAGHFLKTRIKSGDVVLVKGSQGVRLEKIVKMIMARPEDAAKLLVRQGQEWT